MKYFDVATMNPNRSAACLSWVSYAPKTPFAVFPAGSNANMIGNRRVSEYPAGK